VVYRKGDQHIPPVAAAPSFQRGRGGRDSRGGGRGGPGRRDDRRGGDRRGPRGPRR
jgi:hypothetical protein